MTPTATGGRLIKALKNIVIYCLPRNCFIDSNDAIGRDIIMAMVSADNETYKDNPIISIK